MEGDFFLCHKKKTQENKVLRAEESEQKACVMAGVEGDCVQEKGGMHAVRTHSITARLKRQSCELTLTAFAGAQTRPDQENLSLD